MLVDALDSVIRRGGGRLADRYASIRSFTEELCEGLTTEDYVVQSMPDVSPTKWHLAHTSWFFETFILRPHLPGYRPIDERTLSSSTRTT
jgi:hypothetical protein